MNFSFGNETSASVLYPTHLFSDYMEMGILAVILLFGIPINLITLVRKCRYRRYAVTGNQSDIKSFGLSTLHLTIANLNLIVLHCGIRIGWLATYRWIAGTFACKLCLFLMQFTLRCVSYIVTCIALDKTVFVWRYSPRRMDSTTKSTIGLLVLAWIAAFITSIPELIIYQAVEVFPSWSQCITVWQKEIYNKYQISYKHKISYQTSQLIIDFWLPFTIIVACCLLIFIKLIIDLGGKRHHSTLEESAELKPRRSANVELQSDEDVNFPKSQNYQNINILPHQQQYSTRGYPAWIRSKSFWKAYGIIICYIIFWFSYYALQWLVLYNMEFSRFVHEINWFKHLIFINSVINPLIYGFCGD